MAKKENALAAGLRKLLQDFPTPEKIAAEAGELHQAALKGDVVRLKTGLSKLDSKGNINEKDARGDTALYIASLKGHEDVVEELLKNGANPLICCDGSGEIPLHVARNCTIVNVLVKHGGEVNVVNAHGNTPLHKAVFTQKIDVAKCLVSHGADVNAKNSEGKTPLHCTVETGDYDRIEEMMDLLLKAGSDVNAADTDGKTLMHYSCSTIMAKLHISILLAKGARLDLCDSKGDYPIHHCINMIHMIKEEDVNAAVALLMPTKDFANVGDARGRTALHLLAAGTNVELLDVVVNAGGDIHIRDHYNRTPLHYVSQSSNGAIVGGVLLRHGAIVDAQDFWKRTPLMFAVEKENKACVEILIENGAHLNQVDSCGITALHIACYKDRVDILDVLLEKGANVNAIDADGSTPLHAAAYSGSTHSFERLVRVGAKQNIKDNENNLAVDIAMMKGYHEMISLLSSSAKQECERKFSTFAKEMIDLEMAQELMTKKLFQRTVKNKQKFVFEILQSPFIGRGADDQEAKEIQQAMENTIQTLARRIGEIDPRFGCTVIHAGSSSEGTKTKCPDEFDFMLCLEEFSDACEPPEFQTEDMAFQKQITVMKIGRQLDPVEDADSLQVEDMFVSVSDYVMIKIKDTPEAAPFRTFSGSTSLPCYKMYVGFSKLVERVLFSKDFPKHPRLVPVNVTFDPALTFQWRGSVYKDMTIDVDIVPAIRLPSWSTKVEISSPLLTEDVKKLPYLAVPKMTSAQNENLWRCSLSLVESAIFRKLRPNVRNSYVACKTLLSSFVLPQISFGGYEEEMEIFKSMHEDSFDESIQLHECVESLVPSYILKMTFLSLLEERVKCFGIHCVCSPQNDLDVPQKTDTNKDGTSPEVLLKDREQYAMLDTKENESRGLDVQEEKVEIVYTRNKRDERSIYGPAIDMNIAERNLEFDLDLVCDVFKRCETFLRDRFVPSVFNPRHNVLGHGMLSGDAEKALVFIQLINELLDDR